jgi:hypothetical protein
VGPLVGFIVADVAGDGVTDDTAAIQQAIHAGRAERRPVLLPGQLLVTDTISVPDYSTVLGSGPNSTYQYLGGELAAGTRVIAGRDMDVLFDVDSCARVEGIGVDAAYIAGYGFRFRGARPTGANLEVINAAKGGFLFAKTQNGTFSNLCSKFGAAAAVLANGARNNHFDAFTSEVSEQFYAHPSVPYEDADLFLWAIDETNPLLGGEVTQGGNDGNVFVGGINERAPRAHRWHNSNGNSAGPSGIVNDFRSVETTATVAFDNPEDINFGKLVIDGGKLFLDGDSSAMSVGTGVIEFRGPVVIYGGANLRGRGLTMNSNLINGMGFDTAQGGASGIPYALHGGSGPVINWNSEARMFEVGPGGSAVQGVQFTVDGAGRSGNDVGGANVTRGAIGVLRFAITSVIGGNGLVPVYVTLQSAPWRRLLGRFPAGSYVMPLDFNNPLDYSAVAFTKGNVTSFRVKAALSF